MTPELTILGWTLVLALIHIFAAAGARNQETGLQYNAGPRDEPAAPPGVIAARLQRAQANFFETFPLFAAVVLIAHVAGREGPLTLWAALLYLAFRIIYLPLYAFGIPVVRTVAFMGATIGILIDLFVILKP